MNVEVLFFASARERTGITKTNVILKADRCSLREILIEIQKSYPILDLISLSEDHTLVEGTRIAVNKFYCDDLEAEVKDTYQIAIIPPISGG